MILVTGASGFIGSRLVAALAARPDGHEVRALVRSDGAAARLDSVLVELGIESGKVETVRGDVLDADHLGEATYGASLVYHLAGSYRGSNAELREVHVEGTNNLLGALDRNTRLVYVSSTSVYGWDQAWPADEDTPPAPSSAYGRAKLAAELLVNRWAGGDAVVARPTITYGPGDETGMLARAVKLMRSGMRWFPGDGTNRIHLVHIEDLVRALVVLGDTGTGTFVLGGPQATPVRRIMELAAQGAGTGAPHFGLPAGALGALGSLVEPLWAAAGRQAAPPLTRHGIEVATRDRAYSCMRVERELHWTPKVEVEKGIPAAAAWLVGQLEARSAVVRAPVPGLRRRPDGRRTEEPSGQATDGEATEGEAGTDGPSLGFDWRGYLDDPDEGLGTVYERFALDDVLTEAMSRTGSTSLLHAPLFGMMGWPGLDAVMAARRGVRVGLLDFDAERLDAVVKQWRDLGLEPETHLVDSADPATWPEHLDADYDLVFSFAALWWFDDIEGVLAAHARWARRGVLCCTPNRNVFLRMRAALWHRDLFDELNPDAVDREIVEAAAARVGLTEVDTGLFDIPPFPDTSVPLAKLVRSVTGRSDKTDPDAQAWAWSILPYLTGAEPDMANRIARLARWERFLPGSVAPALAHHRYLLFEAICS